MTEPPLSRETEFLGANTGGETLYFPVQLTKSRIIDNQTRLTHDTTHTLLEVLSLSTHIYSLLSPYINHTRPEAALQSTNSSQFTFPPPMRCTTAESISLPQHR